MWKSKVGKRIYECRKNKRFSQKQLGKMVGKDEHYISAIERGLNFPSVDQLIKILNALEVPADAVFCDVLEYSTDQHSNELAEMMKDLSSGEREKIYALLKLQIQQSKERDAAMKELKDKIDNHPKT